jgi:hypothetical protein
VVRGAAAAEGQLAGLPPPAARAAVRAAMSPTRPTFPFPRTPHAEKGLSWAVIADSTQAAPTLPRRPSLGSRKNWRRRDGGATVMIIIRGNCPFGVDRPLENKNDTTTTGGDIVDYDGDTGRTRN